MHINQKLNHTFENEVYLHVLVIISFRVLSLSFLNLGKIHIFAFFGGVGLEINRECKKFSVQ